MTTVLAVSMEEVDGDEWRGSDFPSQELVFVAFHCASL